MNASKRVSSSILCNSQRSLTRLSNPLKTASGSRCSSAAIHTSAQRDPRNVKARLESCTMERGSGLTLKVTRIDRELRMQKGPSRAFSTRPSYESGPLAMKRHLHTTPVQHHGSLKRPVPGEGITIHFHDSSGKLIKSIEGNEGDSLLDLAHEHDVDMEGACEGSVACSTCHVILTPEHYDRLEEPEDDENDMLDMAFGLTDTSRLGCQVKLTKDLEGMIVTLPSATRNFFVDGSKPTKH